MPHATPTPQDLAAINGMLAGRALRSYFSAPIASTYALSSMPATSGTPAPAARTSGIADSLESKLLPAIDYHPVSEIVRPRYMVQTRYPEEVFAALHRPKIEEVPLFVMGSGTLGLCFAGGNRIWINSTLHQYLGMPTEHTIYHEETHSVDPHPDHQTEEIRTRSATLQRFPYATDQLGFGAYHP